MFVDGRTNRTVTTARPESQPWTVSDSMSKSHDQLGVAKAGRAAAMIASRPYVASPSCQKIIRGLRIASYRAASLVV